MGGGSIYTPDINEPENQSNLIDSGDEANVEAYNYQRWNHRIFIFGKLIIEEEAIVEVT